MSGVIRDLLHALSDWGTSDTWTVVTAGLAAMACVIPGCFLLLRRQSLLGDALSHTVLLGIVMAFWGSQLLLDQGWIEVEQYPSVLNALMISGAVVVGILTAVLTEAVQRHGQVESNAALGVVFTLMFALGLLLVRLVADRAHIDPDCVLYGSLETAVWETLPGTDIPRAAVTNAAVLVISLGLLTCFFKEIKVSTFDPGLAMSLGIRPDWLHYGLMAVTAVTLITAFESVGSILVIGMLIVPSASAFLCTQRLVTMLILAMAMAACSALLGHAMAFTVPSVIFGRLGYPEVQDASTAGMMSVASGLIFTCCLLFAPRQGMIFRWWYQLRLAQRVIEEDVLGWLFRLMESDAGTSDGTVADSGQLRRTLKVSRGRFRLALRSLLRRGWVEFRGSGVLLTDPGQRHAASLIRSHRLWESYLSRHFHDGDRVLHESAERAEHYIDADLRERIERELGQTELDPHGQRIPPESTTPKSPE